MRVGWPFRARLDTLCTQGSSANIALNGTGFGVTHSWANVLAVGLFHHYVYTVKVLERGGVFSLLFRLFIDGSSVGDAEIEHGSAHPWQTSGDIGKGFIGYEPGTLAASYLSDFRISDELHDDAIAELYRASSAYTGTVFPRAPMTRPHLPCPCAYPTPHPIPLGLFVPHDMPEPILSDPVFVKIMDSDRRVPSFTNGPGGAFTGTTQGSWQSTGYRNGEALVEDKIVSACCLTLHMFGMHLNPTHAAPVP